MKTRRGPVIICADMVCKEPMEIEQDDECPFCHNGTVEIVGDEVRCRGECGFVESIIEPAKAGDEDMGS